MTSHIHYQPKSSRTVCDVGKLVLCVKKSLNDKIVSIGSLAFMSYNSGCPVCCFPSHFTPYYDDKQMSKINFDTRDKNRSKEFQEFLYLVLEMAK